MSTFFAGDALSGVFLDSTSPDTLARIRMPGVRNIVFGAGVMGKAVLRAAREHGVEISAFCDNNPKLHGRRHEGLPILSPDEAAARFPQGYFFIAIPRGFSLLPQLQSLGLVGRCLTVDIIRDSFTPGLHLPGYIAITVDATAMEQKSLSASPENRRETPVSMLTLIITDCCTLRCVACSHRIPYVPSPRHRRPEEVLRDMDALLSCVDDVAMVSLSSGDSLLHPRVADIVEQLQQREKIGSVSIWTNAIVPFKAEQWRGVNAGKLSFHVTDYHEPAQAIQRFSKDAAALGITTYVSEREWAAIDIGGRPPAPAGTAAALFQICQLAMCVTINDGKLYRCTLVPNAVREGLIPDDPDDSVELGGITPSTTESKSREIHDFLFNKESMAACRYCSGCRPGHSPIIQSAVQLAR